MSDSGEEFFWLIEDAGGAYFKHPSAEDVLTSTRDWAKAAKFCEIDAKQWAANMNRLGESFPSIGDWKAIEHGLMIDTRTPSTTASTEVEALEDVCHYEARVMMALQMHGASIVPHLLDTDENDGERLRRAIDRAIKAYLATPTPSASTEGAWQPIETVGTFEEVTVYEAGNGQAIGHRDAMGEWWSPLPLRPLNMNPTHWKPLGPNPASPQGADRGAQD